jgi:sugar phosphate isomerase/epimerase
MSKAGHTLRIGTLVQSTYAVSHIKQIINHGFESFEITFGSGIGEIDLKVMASEVMAALDGRAVISALGIYGNPLECDTENLDTVRSWELIIDNAHLFGTDIVAGFTGRVRNRPIDDSYDRFEKVFTPLVKRALDRNIKIAFENCDMQGTWNSGDWNIAHTPDAWEQIFDRLPFDNVGLEWEPCHQMVKLIDPIPQLRKWVHKIFHIHGKDATIKWDIIKEHGIYGPKQFVWHRTPGFGDTNWTDVISELRLGDYKGTIDIEGWHDPVYRDELEMTGQVHALEYLKWCRGGKYVVNPEN